MEENKVEKKKWSRKKKWLVGIGIALLVLILAGAAFLLFGQQMMLGSPGGGSPWLDTDLKENIKADAAVAPGEDFHLYANLDWLRNAEIPEGYTSAGPFVDVTRETDRKAMALFDDASLQGRDAQLIRDLRAAYLDYESRDALGLEPLRPMLQDLESIGSIEELSDFFCDPERCYLVPRLVALENTPALNDATHYILDISESGLLLRDSAEYEKQTIMGQMLSGFYKTVTVEMLEKLGYDKKEAGQIFEDALAFEGKLASALMTADETVAPDYLQRINNEMTPTEAAALCPAFPLERLMASRGYGAAEKLLVEQPEYLKRLGEVYTQENLDGIRHELMVQYVLGQISLVDEATYLRALELQNQMLGSQGILTREEYAYQFVKSSLVEPMERCYLEKYDATGTKARITALCGDILSYYRTLLEQNDWLSAQTREAAIEKLEKITVNVAYPEKWHDYESLDLQGLNLRECVKVLNDFALEQDAALTNQPVDKELWDFGTLDCNAYYNPQDNSINILLGILGGDFYREDMTDEELYGGIGAVIGHEISHAFDTNGAQFDANGDLGDWWTEEDYAAFTARAEKLAAYYDGITAFSRYNVKGVNVQTEAIADMAGLKCMLGIAAEKPDFDYDLFFRHYAGIWRSLTTQQAEYIALQYDVHPLNYLRTNVTLQQFEEFYETYGIQPGDKMYLAPEDRVSVW